MMLASLVKSAMASTEKLLFAAEILRPAEETTLAWLSLESLDSSALGHQSVVDDDFDISLGVGREAFAELFSFSETSLGNSLFHRTHALWPCTFQISV